MSGRGRIAAWLGAAAAAASVAGCAGKSAPAPAIVRPAPPPASFSPPPEAIVQDSPDLPLTAGDWSYAGDTAGSGAVFGLMELPMFSVRCDNARRQVTLSVAGAPQPLRLRTSFGQRALPAGAALAAADPLLDEIVFSRGRFTVERDGLPALILPSWPEPARVVEDCRG